MYVVAEWKPALEPSNCGNFAKAVDLVLREKTWSQIVRIRYKSDETGRMNV